MLRDRIPRMVNLALLSCKCKEKWLDHVYHNWIWIYKDNNERLKATRDILGIDKKGKVHFNFEDTIMWDNLTIEEKKFWKTVISRVSWFRKWYQYVENTYSTSLKVGKDITAIKLEIMRDYLPDMCPTKEDSAEIRERKNKNINIFVDFLIDSFENRI
jgi:hypothetical protein